MKLVWAPSDHTYKQLSLVRLHFTDATSPETLKAQLALFRDQYSDNKDEIDSITKSEGTTNYKYAEQQLLLSVVADHMPRQKIEWNHVAAAYNTRKDAKWIDRSSTSLKRKFTNLYSAARKRKASSMSSMERAALSLRHKIVDRSKAAPGRECANPRCANSPPGSPASGNADEGTHTPVLHEDQVLGGVEVRDGGTDVEYTGAMPTTSELDVASKGSFTALEDNDGGVMAAGAASIQSTSTANVAKGLHTHCDVIQLFMWFQSRDQNQSKQWRTSHDRALLEERTGRCSVI
ncbi:hypothetical protein PHYPSEUDO_014227 [Phytophthora pseudosyringae]|uniref:DUF6818 domain-containing protein n=1 Tax=Phytophthora pseudosyringae TaxID=221518 RepID=A0A8T1WL59_9STRA|nr:hypothetical protein PHYPSEUDO_014227 [Phytophthora pseudosyringae]